MQYIFTSLNKCFTAYTNVTHPKLIFHNEIMNEEPAIGIISEAASILMREHRVLVDVEILPTAAERGVFRRGRDRYRHELRQI